MHATFSFHRFTLLLKQHWAENKKRYILSFFAFIGLLVIWFLFIMLTNEYYPMAEGLQEVTFFFSLFAIGSFYASQIFRELGSRSRGINYLMVPASAMEKLLCSLTFSVVLFFIIFTAAFYLSDGLMVLIANALHPSYNVAGAEGTQVKASLINVFNYSEPGQNDNMNPYILLLFLAIQSLFILGSVYFEKYSFIKTAISMFVFMLIFFLILYVFNEWLMPPGGFHEGFSSYRVIGDNNKEVLVQLPDWVGPLLRGLLMYALPPFFWTVTYFRLREKQV